jgi:SulP family sulfate permease
VPGDPNEIIIDFKESKVVDMSAIEAVSRLTERYKKAGKKLHLRHLSEDCKKLLKNAEDVIEVNIMEDPNYKVATDKVSFV